jgi:hypothetical protein
VFDWVNFGSLTRFRAWLLAMAVAIALSQAMQLMGWIDLSTAIYRTPNFGWLGNSVGGLLFGIGMTLGAGCGQRTLVRVGAGNLKSFVVLLVLGITAYMTLRGLLAVVRIEVFQRTNLDLASYGLTDQGLPTLFAQMFGTEPWAVTVTVSALVVLTLLWFVFKDGAFRASGGNMLVGAALGLLVASAWYVTGVIGFDDFEPVPFESVTFIAPVGNAVNYLMTWTGSKSSKPITPVTYHADATNNPNAAPTNIFPPLARKAPSLKTNQSSVKTTSADTVTVTAQGSVPNIWANKVGSPWSVNP